MSEQSTKQSLTFTLAKWWGYLFSACYLLYGGVNIVLSLMDSNVKTNSAEIMSSILFILIGIVLVTIVSAFRDGKEWGRYGLIGVNLITIGSLITRLGDPSSLVLSLLCLAATVLLFLPTTRPSLSN